MDIYLMTDQPPTCPKCGARVKILEGVEGDKQVVECPECRYRYRLEADDTKPAPAYGKPKVGARIERMSAYESTDELSRDICKEALALGWPADEEERALIEDCTDDEERSDGPDFDEGEALDELAEGAICWLNDQEKRSFLYWSIDKDRDAFGLWASVDFALEDVGFVSKRDQEYPPDGYEGEWLHINDHGNVTLFLREGGADTEQWAVV